MSPRSGQARGWRSLLILPRIGPGRLVSLWQGQILAAVCILGAVLLRWLLHPLLANNAPFSTFFLALLIASVWGGPPAGLSVLVCGALVVSHFWFPPAWHWTLAAPSFALLVAFLIMGTLLIIVAALLRALLDMRQKSEERATLLAQEMQHRVLNVLGLVMAISSHTARNAKTVAEHQALFSARLGALARAQELTLEDHVQGLELGTLLDRLLEPFDTARFSLQGPKLVVASQLGATLALVMHELSTNAVKYGALSVPEGRVDIAWAVEGERTKLEWREVGGPPVTAPTKTGLGSRLIRAGFPAGAGEAQLTFASDGLRCVMRF